jgi:hypothetical protein
MAVFSGAYHAPRGKTAQNKKPGADTGFAGTGKWQA